MKKIIFTLPWLFMTFTLNAQNCEQFTGSLLWKVSGNGLEHPSYILGTHHLAETSTTTDWPGFHEALEGSTQIVGELMLNDMGSLQNALMQHMYLPDDVTYESLLSEEDYNSLDEALKKTFGVGLDQFGRMTPGMINMMFIQTMYLQLMPGDNPAEHISIDQYVQVHGFENNKKVIGLETVEDQIQALFYAETLKNQAESLVCSIKNLDEAKEELLALNRYYAEGNLYDVYAHAFENKEKACQMSEKTAFELNKKRNDKWMEKLPGILADGPSFIAVGMLHLCGQEGLLYQLDQLGYTVEPVK